MLLNNTNIETEINQAVKAPYIAIDTETIDLEDKSIVGYSFAYMKNNKIYAHYVPISHKYITNVNRDLAIRCIKKLMEKNVIMHNAPFDLEVLYYFADINYDNVKVDDTLIIAHLLDERRRCGLKTLALMELGYKMTEFKELCGIGKKRIPFSEVRDANAIHQYASDDARYTLELFNKLYPQVQMDKDLNWIYTEIEKPLLLVVTDMQINGLTIDKKIIDNIEQYCIKKVTMAKEKLDYIMPNVNLNSPKQLREWFIGYRRLEPIKFSRKTQQPSVDAEFLEHYSNYKKCPEIKLILDYRKYNKILSTFIPALTPKSGNKVKAKFKQCGTVSGRFSSSEPNMQNIPRDIECDSEYEDTNIRKAIIADKGHVLIGADYSQIELRITGLMSEDKALCDNYAKMQDVHQMTADACGCNRQHAKTINFGLIYGMREKTLAKQLGVSPKKANLYFHKYWLQYPGVAKYMNDLEMQIWDMYKKNYHAEVKTKFGRVRRLSKQFKNLEPWQQSGKIRSLINATIQGTAADIMKLSLVIMYPYLKQENARIVLTVHDEVLVSCPKENKERCEEIVYSAMMAANKYLKFPVEVDLNTGETWFDAHKSDLDNNGRINIDNKITEVAFKTVGRRKCY